MNSKDYLLLKMESLWFIDLIFLYDWNFLLFLTEELK